MFTVWTVKMEWFCGGPELKINCFLCPFQSVLAKASTRYCPKGTSMEFYFIFLLLVIFLHIQKDSWLLLEEFWKNIYKQILEKWNNPLVKGIPLWQLVLFFMYASDFLPCLFMRFFILARAGVRSISWVRSIFCELVTLIFKPKKKMYYVRIMGYVLPISSIDQLGPFKR